jgi:hypothetical protein
MALLLAQIRSSHGAYGRRGNMKDGNKSVELGAAGSLIREIELG